MELLSKFLLHFLQLFLEVVQESLHGLSLRVEIFRHLYFLIFQSPNFRSQIIDFFHLLFHSFNVSLESPDSLLLLGQSFVLLAPILFQALNGHPQF